MFWNRAFLCLVSELTTKPKMIKIKNILTMSVAIALAMSANAAEVVLTGGTFSDGPFKGKTVTTFRIDDSELILSEWNAVNPATYGFNDLSAPTAKGANYPVENVSWYDAVKWCNLKSLASSLTPVYQTGSINVSSITRNNTVATVTTNGTHRLSTGNHVTISGATPAGYNLTAAITVLNSTQFTYTVSNALTTPATGTITASNIYKSGEIVPIVNATATGYRLPTEMEWQWAAIGGTDQSTFKYSGSNTANSVAWTSENSPNSTQVVKTKAANTKLIYDMSGNVFEWCFDDVSGVNGRRVRGGGYVVDNNSCAISVRGYKSPSQKEYGFGFRIYRNN